MTAVDVDPYEVLLQSKLTFDTASGFDLEAAIAAGEVGPINPMLKPHQCDIVRWAVHQGRGAIFAAFGLGKSMIQLETVAPIMERTGRPVLIVCPLGVRQEFKRDAALLGLSTRFVRFDRELDLDNWRSEIFLTNYESIRDGRLDPSVFAAVSLDEAAVLRSLGTKTFQTFRQVCRDVPYRFVATATPSPNEHTELLNYADFLGVMDKGQALTRFFKRNSTKAGELTLMEHRAAEFWSWVASWAVFVQRPSDLGHDDTGYVLPELDVRFHEIEADALGNLTFETQGQGVLVQDGALGVVGASKVKRSTIDDRVAAMMELIADGCRAATRVHAGVPQEEPGPDQREEARGLPARPGEAQGPEPEVAGGEPGSVPSADPPTCRGESGEGERAVPPVVPGQPGPGCGHDPAEQAQEVRADAGRVRRHGFGTGRSVRDLPDGAERRVGRGSLSRLDHGEGSALQTVQHGARQLQGRSEDLAGGDRLPLQWIVWVELNDEQRAVEQALAEAGVSFSSIYGGKSVDETERLLDQWRSRETDVLIGKPVMLGAGVNLQQCHRAIFLGVSFKFSDVFQAFHRIHRFGQTRRVRIDIIHADTERQVVATLRKKWKQHEELTNTMSELIRTHGLSNAAMAEHLARSIGTERVAAAGDGWEIVNDDTVRETRRMATDSVDMIWTSPPYGTQYEYVAAVEDFGHNDDNDAFWSQMDHLTPEMLRVLKPGRMCIFHVKDRIRFGNVTGKGVATVQPFHAEAIMHMIGHGFDYLGEIVLDTDVVRENNQTYRLTWSEVVKDRTKLGVGTPEKILLFRKPQTDRTSGAADTPVSKTKDEYTLARWQIDAAAFWKSSGDRFITPDELEGLPVPMIRRVFADACRHRIYDYEQHVALGEDFYARGRLPTTFALLAPATDNPLIWTDVNRMQGLNTKQAAKGRELHVCPAPFDVVDRCILQWSNPGELIFDPFGGLGTVVYRALHHGRRGRCHELNPTYWADAVAYARAKEAEVTMPSLFDMLDVQLDADVDVDEEDPPA